MIFSALPDMKMEGIISGMSDFEDVPFTPSSFVKPASVTFRQSNGNKSLWIQLIRIHHTAVDLLGRLRKWDYIEVHDSIAVLLYERDKHAVLMVRQFRPTVYARALRRARECKQPEPTFHEGMRNNEMTESSSLSRRIHL